MVRPTPAHPIIDEPGRDDVTALSPIGAPPSGPVLTTDQVDHWRRHGCVVVDGVFPGSLIDRVRADAVAHFPRPGSEAAAEIVDFGSGITFPSAMAGINEVTLHPRLLGAVGQLLDTPIGSLRLTQSELWAKYGHTERSAGALDNQDQRMHVDYPNHTLVHPAPWDRPEAVEAILYLSDRRHCGGATAVVPRSGPDDPAYRWPLVDTPGVGDLRFVNDRVAAETYLADRRPGIEAWRAALYRKEQTVDFTVGTVVFYRHDTWHRGTPLVPGGLRLVQNLTFRRAECEWISTLHRGWSWAMYHPDQVMERLVAAASLDQRAVLGFPQPGSPYWCDETLLAVEARYGAFGFDVAPYRPAG
jgi:hypothetical protein